MSKSEMDRQDVFLINRLNSRYVCGRWDPTLRSGRRWLIFCIVAALLTFLMFAAMFVYAGGVNEILLAVLPNRTITAEVIGNDTFGCGRNLRMTCYMLTYSYEVNGQPFTYESSASAEEYEQATRSGEIEITYALGFPWATHVGETGIQWGYFTFLPPALILPAVILIPVWIFLGEMILLRRYRRRGTLIYGTITSALGRRQRNRSATNYLVTVHFRFISPSGKPVEGKVTRGRSDLRDQPLPPPGTPCAVVYISDKDFFLL